jgi:hypothetical protein
VCENYNEFRTSGQKATFDLPGEKKIYLIVTMSVLGDTFMPNVIFGAALVFSGLLGVTLASAESLRDKHSTAGFGVGGWTVDVKVNSETKTVSSVSAGGVSSATTEVSSKAFSHASAGGVSSSPPIEVSSASAGAVSSSARDPLDLHQSREILFNDSDCVFVAQNTPTGNRWRPGCK